MLDIIAELRVRGRTGPSGADSNSCLPVSPSNAKSLFDVLAPTAHTTAVLLSAVVAMEEPLPWWLAHHAVLQDGGFPGMSRIDMRSDPAGEPFGQITPVLLNAIYVPLDVWYL